MPENAILVNTSGGQVGHLEPDGQWYLSATELATDVFFKPAANFNTLHEIGSVLNLNVNFVVGGVLSSPDTLAITVTPVNDQPSITVGVSPNIEDAISIFNIGLTSDPFDDGTRTTATAKQGDTLRVSHDFNSDIDSMTTWGGLPASTTDSDVSVSYQWLRSATATTVVSVISGIYADPIVTLPSGYTLIVGATAASYTLTEDDATHLAESGHAADLPKFISVVATYTDADGTVEHVFSKSTMGGIADVLENRSPVITIGTGDSASLVWTEANDLTTNAPIEVTGSGTLTVTDPDFSNGDSISAITVGNTGLVNSLGAISFTDFTTGSSITTVPSHFGSWSQAELLSVFSVVATTDNTNPSGDTKGLAWSFDSDANTRIGGSSVFDVLHAGEVVTITYPVTVTDSGGAVSATQNVTVTVTGTDEAMTVDPEVPSQAVNVVNSWIYDLTSSFFDPEVKTTGTAEHFPMSFSITGVKQNGAAVPYPWITVTNGTINVSAIPAGVFGSYVVTVKAVSNDDTVSKTEAVRNFDIYVPAAGNNNGEGEVRLNTNTDDPVTRGNDLMVGVDSDTIANYDNSPNAVSISLATSFPQQTNPLTTILTISSGIDTLQNINGLVGSVYNDTLKGNQNPNNLDGGLGNDTLSGAGGDDVDQLNSSSTTVPYTISTTVGDQIIEKAGAGVDTVWAVNTSYILPSNVENLELIGGATGSAHFAIGNGLSNKLTGDAGNNRLDGGRDSAGNGKNSSNADTMIGGDGNDTYVVDNAADVVTESSATGGNDTIESSVTLKLKDNGNVENLLLVGTLAINGTGNELNNQITGNDGNNILDGKAGADVMTGFAGNDTYVVNNTGDSVFETDGTTNGVDTIKTSVELSGTFGGTALNTNVENLTLLDVNSSSGSSSPVYATGNNVDNILTGNNVGNTISGGAGSDTLIGAGGADSLDGGAGADVMVGGAAGDTYSVDTTNIPSGHVVTLTAGDVVTEKSGGGTDTVNSSVNYGLSPYVEKLNLTGTATDGIGNSSANIIDRCQGNCRFLN